ncbi:membrane protein insertase YidC [Ectothiorhodospiraceae bacterium WFHF3C12]|nr:membrane protein insertase YidC [Ectothiorhodospiraceae bacterium WFHF3C12]
MENLRLVLFLALGVVLMLIWSAWQQDYGTPPPQSTTEQAPAGSADDGASPAAPGAAAPAESTPSTAAPGSGAGEGDATTDTAAEARDVRVLTDLLDVTISTEGGTIVSARLRKHPVSNDNPEPFPLLHRNGDLFVAQSGLLGRDRPAPDHQAVYSAERTDYRLQEGDDEVVVALRWSSGDGLTVTKRYIFHRDSYEVDLEHRVANESGTPWQGYQYAQLRRTPPEEEGNILLIGARSYTGGVIYSPEEKYEKFGFDDMAETALNRDVRNGWVAMIQHYFLAAWIPPRDTTTRFYTRAAANSQYIIGLSSPWQTVQPGGSTVFNEKLFVGPKEQDRLEQVAQGLELTVDYGVLTFISGPLFWLLNLIHGVVGNWGWAIVLLTLGIKIVFYPLSETSYRSMAKMRKLQPKMQQLKERFGDDKQKMNQELMQLYQKEKINPLAGCLPILIQIPVFIALYWVLLESAELRAAPWILWIDDLSVRDPYFVLPLLMALSMFIQQRISPAPMDPIQQKVMMALPVVFGFFFLWFPAGLVLYWVVNNSLSILQQWLINRRMEAQGTK